jgi:hypothetical protein
MKKTKILAKRTAVVVVPMIVFAVLCFFVNNWRDGLATKNELLSNYSTSVQIESKYVTIAQNNLHVAKILELEKHQQGIHKDVRLILFGLAATNPKFNQYILKMSTNLERPEPPGQPPKKKRTEIVENGN